MSAVVHDLLDHLYWADERILQLLDREPRCASDAEILRTLAHVAGCEALWLARMRGEPSPVAVWPAIAHEECVAIFGDTHAELRTIQRALSRESLAREFDYVNSEGQPWRNTVEEALVHLAMHGQYHRGQLVRTIRRTGGRPVATDFIVWARTAKRMTA